MRRSARHSLLRFPPSVNKIQKTRAFRPAIHRPHYPTRGRGTILAVSFAEQSAPFEKLILPQEITPRIIQYIPGFLNFIFQKSRRDLCRARDDDATSELGVGHEEQLFFVVVNKKNATCLPFGDRHRSGVADAGLGSNTPRTVATDHQHAGVESSHKRRTQRHTGPHVTKRTVCDSQGVRFVRL